jgi:thiamine-phosphate pyrophosphorylase
MSRRQPLPRLWLMTDERQGDELWRALERLPKGAAGVVFRHYRLAPSERRQMLRKVQRIASRRRLLLLIAMAGPRGDGVHGRRGPGLRSASAHNLRELKTAERSGAALIFLSPAFATRSHPEARPLGPIRFGLVAVQARVPVVALGGVDARNVRRLPHIYGWAGIDAWTR